MVAVASSVSNHVVVQMGLRAPRVAIVIDGGATWMEWARLGLYAASRCWGGAGFVLVPHLNGVVAAELLQMVAAYDPDFVVTLQPTVGQLQRLRPGVPPATPIEDLNTEAAAHVRVNQLEQQARPTDNDRRARVAVAAACSPYRFEYSAGDRQEDTVALSSDGTGSRLTPIEDIPDIAAGHLRQGAAWDGAPGIISAARYGLMDDPMTTSSTALKANYVVLRWLLDPDDQAPAPDDAVWAGPPGSIRLNVIPSQLPTAFSARRTGWIGSPWASAPDETRSLWSPVTPRRTSRSRSVGIGCTGEGSGFRRHGGRPAPRRRQSWPGPR